MSALTQIILGACAVFVLLIFVMNTAPVGWRTIVFNTLAAVGTLAGSVAVFALPYVDYAAVIPWEHYVGPELAISIVVSLNLAGIFLRMVTGTKEEEEEEDE